MCLQTQWATTPSTVSQRGFRWSCLLYDGTSLAYIILVCCQWNVFTESVHSKWTNVQYSLLQNFTCHLLVNSVSISLSYFVHYVTWVHQQPLLGSKNDYSVALCVKQAWLSIFGIYYACIPGKTVTNHNIEVGHPLNTSVALMLATLFNTTLNILIQHENRALKFAILRVNFVIVYFYVVKALTIKAWWNCSSCIFQWHDAYFPTLTCICRLKKHPANITIRTKNFSYFRHIHMWG